MRRFRDGDRDALERVYQTYVQKIANLVRYGIRLPGGAASVSGLGFRADEVADLVQETFTKAFAVTARRAFDGARDYGPYLYAIARNVAADRARRTGRELPTPFAELERAHDAELEPVAADEAAWADPATIAVVRAYLEGLDAELRRVHEARYVLGLSQRDAADRLGISRQNLRTLEGRVRDGLRRELERLGLSTRTG